MRAFLDVQPLIALQVKSEMLPYFLLSELQAAEAEGLQMLMGETQDYPPPIPTSSYIRTFRYHDTQTIVPGDLDGYVDMPMPYSIYLRGDDEGRQPAYMHLGRWLSIVAIREKLVDPIREMLDARIQALMIRVFGN